MNNNNVNNNNYVRLSASFIILFKKIPFGFSERYFLKERISMKDEITFEEMYEAYNLCLKNKKRKLGTYKFVNDNLCENLMGLVDMLNNRKYMPQSSNCYVITDPALREIYAAQFGDRVIQHFI